MGQLHFSVDIDASPDRVWKILWDDATYRDWTSVFAEGSYAVSDWKEGSKIQFIDPKSNAGLSSIIEKLIPNQFMSFKHITEIRDGKEQPSPQWSGSFENYTLTEKNGSTTLGVDLDIPDKDKQMFLDMFPQALQRVKELAEAS